MTKSNWDSYKLPSLSCIQACTVQELEGDVNYFSQPTTKGNWKLGQKVLLGRLRLCCCCCVFKTTKLTIKEISTVPLMSRPRSLTWEKREEMKNKPLSFHANRSSFLHSSRNFSDWMSLSLKSGRQEEERLENFTLAWLSLFFECDPEIKKWNWDFFLIFRPLSTRWKVRRDGEGKRSKKAKIYSGLDFDKWPKEKWKKLNILGANFRPSLN